MDNSNNNNLWYNKRLRHFAHENRSGMTKAEACLWKYVLSGKRMCGINFAGKDQYSITSLILCAKTLC